MTARRPVCCPYAQHAHASANGQHTEDGWRQCILGGLHVERGAQPQQLHRHRARTLLRQQRDRPVRHCRWVCSSTTVSVMRIIADNVKALCGSLTVTDRLAGMLQVPSSVTCCRTVSRTCHRLLNMTIAAPARLTLPSLPCLAGSARADGDAGRPLLHAGGRDPRHHVPPPRPRLPRLLPQAQGMSTPSD